MSFSSELKEELTKVSTHNNECCKLAELAGYLIANCNIVKVNDKFVLRMITSSSSAVRRMYNAFRGLYDITPVTNIEKGKLAKETTEKFEKDLLYELVVDQDEDLRKIFNNSLVNIDVNLQIVIEDNGKIMEKECCRRSFLRGVFLGSGSMIDPNSRKSFGNCP
ncbi:MAG: DNA-binding protein WhiA [Clostridia bacterium]|nr:DNA-binding protein WhiA [Clostridia bacterium]